jgi:PIN domain nuclease of toxin-antitoxin system
MDSKKLSRIQLRTLESTVRRGEPVALSAISLLEISVLASGRKPALDVSLEEFFEDLSSNPIFRVLPLTYEVAHEVQSLDILRDPADRAIAATARVHRLRLVTSDRRIIESKLVLTVE